MKNETNTINDQEVLQLPPEQLAPNPWNRKQFNEEKLKELADSIRAVGILEPIIARPLAEPVEGQETPLQIIAGERRWRAAQLAGLPWVPVLLRNVDERGAREAHAIENLQREDLNAVEEGENYRQLLEELDCKVEDLEERLGKKRSHIYSRLRLATLPDAIKQAIIQGKLDATIGNLLASIPDEKQQGKALRDVLEGGRAEYDEDTGSFVKQPMSFRQAKAHIEENYRKSLKEAPFDTQQDYGLKDGDVRLPCDKCPHRTGNMEGLPSGSNPNVCTYLPCYAEKTAAHQDMLLAPYRAKGLKVLEGKAAAKLWQYGSLAYSSGYREANGTHVVKGNSVTYRKLLGRDMPETVWAVNPRGVVVELVQKAALEKAMVEAGHLQPRDEKPKPESAEELAKRQLAERADVLASDTAVSLLLQKIEGGKPEHFAEVLQFIIETFDTADGFNHEVISRRRGWDNGTHIVAAAEGMKQWPDKLGLLLEGYLADPYGSTYEAEWIERLGKRLGVKVDWKALQKEALAALKAEAQVKQPGEEPEQKPAKETKATKAAKAAKAKKGKAKK